METLTVRHRKVANVLAGEPWIYPNALIGEAPEPGCYRVVTDRDTILGYADINPAAPVRGRLLTREHDWIGDEAWVETRLVAAIERRLRLGFHLQASGCRLVNGEGDGLPGLAIDCYGTTLVVDVGSRGMRDRLPLVVSFLKEKLSDMKVVTRLGADAARREGVDVIEPEQQSVTFCEQAVRFQFDIGPTQKTGFFLDQRDNRRLVGLWGRGRKVLDLFSYHGGFALAALANGAQSALAVDSSNAALEAAGRNATANGLELDILPGDVFDHLDGLVDEGPFDLIICDPPKLAPSKKDYPKAMGAYRFLVDRCLRCLAPRGVLLLASCSSAIGHEDLRKLCQQQSRKADCQLDVVAATGHPADHPWPVAFTGGRYLSALLLEKRTLI